MCIALLGPYAQSPTDRTRLEVRSARHRIPTLGRDVAVTHFEAHVTRLRLTLLRKLASFSTRSCDCVHQSLAFRVLKCSKVSLSFSTNAPSSCSSISYTFFLRSVEFSHHAQPKPDPRRRCCQSAPRSPSRSFSSWFIARRLAPMTPVCRSGSSRSRSCLAMNRRLGVKCGSYTSPTALRARCGDEGAAGGVAMAASAPVCAEGREERRFRHENKSSQIAEHIANKRSARSSCGGRV